MAYEGAVTTIAYDGISLAAEGRSTVGNEIIREDVEKIKVIHGRVYGMVGAITLLDAAIEWHNSGADPAKLPPYPGEESWFLIVIDEHGLFCYSSKMPYARCNEFNIPTAFGSGDHFALGAMLAGKTAKEAVEIACKVDTQSGGRIRVINIAEALAPKLKEAAE